MTSTPSPLATSRSYEQPRADPVVARHREGHRELVTKLASAAEDVAQDAFSRLRWENFRGPAGVELVSALALKLTESGLLPKRAQANRLSVLLKGLKIAGSELRALADAARTFPSHLRVTAAEFLPAHIRPRLYGERSHETEALTPASVAPSTADPSTPDPSERIIPVLLSASDAAALHTIGPAAYSTVLLLSHPDRQDGNRKLLAGADAGLDPIVIDSLGNLRQSLTASDEVCACVIDESFLALLSESDQRALFAELAGYSTFIRIRVHDAGLKLTYDEIRQIIKRSRGLGSAVPNTALSFQSDGAVRPSEIDDFKRAGDLLRSHEGVAFVLGELSAAESRLLVAAARARVQAERLDGAVQVKSLITRFLTGGRSGARLATVRLNDSGRTFVAKITSKQYALDEIQRFRTFIQEWDQQLQPEAYFHGDEAVILFGLVPSEDDRSAPAGMLEDRVAELWNDQWMHTHNAVDLVRRADALGRGLERAVQDIVVLNSSRPQNAGFPSYVNPPLEHIDALEAGGFDWGLDPVALAARVKAATRFRLLEHAAVVHGDVHLRNMLIRGDGDIHLIDYASSGPGHPAIDLVRLELSLYLGPVRQFEREQACVGFQYDLSINTESLSVIRERYPSFFQCHVNAACASGMVAARDHAIDAVRAHDGDVDDYLAAKYLLAWQHLGLIGSHTGLARAVIAALAPKIAAW